jgi:uncharacterized protein
VRIRLWAVWIVALQITVLAEFPRPDGYVNDYAAVLTEDDEEYLEDFLKTLEAETSAEIAVVTVRSLEGMTIEEYANRLFAQWGIGKKQEDNGVLLLVAPEDKAVRIEVGYGVEPILPDGLAGEIIRAEMLPEFRAGNLRKGIGRGINRISQIVRRDPTALSLRTSSPEPQRDHLPAVLVVPFFGLFITLGGFFAGLAVTTRTFGPLLWGGLFAGIPLVIATEFVSAFWLVVLLCIGLCAMLMGQRSGRSPYWKSMLRTGVPGPVVDDEPLAWVMGGTDGSSTDGGSSASHGSSSSSDFGGGSSGGGGASSRW